MKGLISLDTYDIRLIASDIDDTMLPKGGEISEATRRAVADCQTRGVIFALASGRWFPSTVSVAEDAGVKGPLIVANGGCVITVKGEVLKEFPMADSDVGAAYSVIGGCGALITSYIRGAIYRLNTRTMENRPPEKHSFFGGSMYEVVDDDVSRFESEALTGVYKMEVYSNDASLLSDLKAKLEDKGLEVSSSFRTNIEITSKGLGKGHALTWLAGHLGVPRECVMAFGDNTNDMQLLKSAGVGVAMGNAVDALKAAADIIAPDCKADGLARTLEKYVGGARQ